MTDRATRAALRLLVLSLFVPLLIGAAVGAELKPVTSVEGITEYRLEKGMQGLLFPDPSKPTFTVNLTYFVGSRHEGRGEKGMAHLLEHMVFKGTPTNPDIWKALEDHGARFNGTTWVDRTNYFETLPSTEPGNLEWALSMEADRMINSDISADDLSTEFSVVRNEFEMGENDPTGVLWERMMSTAYIWHNYGDSTIGSRSDIERVPIENLRAYYEKYYQPDNAMLVVAGNFEQKQALELIQKHFGSIPRPTRELDATYTIEPVQDGARHVELKRVGDVAAVGTVYHIPAGSHEDYAVMEVIQQILTDEPGGRLYKALVESGKASGVFGIAFGWEEPGVAINIAQVRADESPDPVLQEMIATVEGLSTQEITEEEVKRAKRTLLKNFELAMKDSRRVGIELSEWAAAGDWRLMFLHRDRVEQVTTEQTRQAAAMYFKESNRTSGIFYPTGTEMILRAEIPAAPDVATVLKGYIGGEALAEGEAFDATPENIESRVTRSESASGMKLALLPKETRGDAVSAVITLRFATEKDLKGKITAAGLVPQMLMRGTEKYSYQEVQDMLDELKANVNMNSGGGMGDANNSMSVNIRTDREHLKPVIELVYEILVNPTFPESEFAIVKKENLAALEEQLSEPQARAFNFVFRALNPYPPDDVRYIPTMEESIERLQAVKVQDLKQFHKEFYGASFAQMTVIGDFDAKEIERTIGQTVGSWKSPKPYERIATKFRGDIEGGDDKINTPDKKMAMVACGTNVEMRDDDPDYPALHMSNYVLGASAKSRLLDRLRQKEGLSYGAGSFFAAGSLDRDAVFAAMAIAGPANSQKAHDSMMDEFGKLVKEGVPADELAGAKNSYALQVKNRLSNDGTVARMINDGLYLDRTMDYYKNLYESVDALTPEQIKSALQKYVNLNTMVMVQAGDFAEMEQAKAE
jgi:zinc protease